MKDYKQELINVLNKEDIFEVFDTVDTLGIKVDLSSEVGYSKLADELLIHYTDNFNKLINVNNEVVNVLQQRFADGLNAYFEGDYHVESY